jgi:TolA-binding protein
MLAVAGVLVASAAAATGWVIESHRAGRESDTAPLDSQRQTLNSRARHSGALSAKKVAAPTESDGADAGIGKESAMASVRVSGVPAQAQGSVRPGRNREAGQSKALDASSMFAEGSRARRSGDIAFAVEIYGKLTQLYPNAPEAQQAKLILAELELQRGQFARALEYFRECRSGSMAPEAVWGMARAYRAISDTRRERDMLGVLVTEYPDSAYAQAARHRLDELQ